MLVNHLLWFFSRHWLIILALVVAWRVIRNKFHKGFHKYSGPALAAYTDWWRFLENWSRESHWTHLALHRKHGDVVRLGPNSLSFADPEALSVIYGFSKGFVKSEFYPVQQPVSNGGRFHSLFSTTDESYHAKYRRCVNGAFAMTNLMNYEPLVESTTDVFIEATARRFCDTNQTCDLYRWLQFFALDVLCELTWSKRMGFIEENRDVGNVVESVAKNLAYAGPIGQMPWLDLVWDKNPIRLRLQSWGWCRSASPTTAFALERIGERADQLESIKTSGDIDTVTQRSPDFLMKFTQAQYDHPEFMNNGQVLATCNSMITAGSETTAISLSAIFHNLMQHPPVYRKLMDEIDVAHRDGTISDRPNKKVSWAEAQKLPYLDAVIQESFRLHPAVGLTQEKIVPEPGIEIAGHYVPGGTIVGCNPWILQRRPEIFGNDVDVFRPERWLEASPHQLQAMRATMFQFGGGSRTCIGKHIALLNVYKIVPTFLRNFTLELPEHDHFRHQCVWMVRILGFEARISRRDSDL